MLMAKKTYFFTQPKNLTLTKPNIVTKVEKKNSLWVVSLKTDYLAKDLYLNFPGIEGFFSDNYFDLIPGKERIITFIPKDKKLSPIKIELTSLIDSY